MSESLRTIRTEVKAYQIDLHCEQADCDGMMVTCEGMVYMSSPPQYPHKCTKCDTKRYITGITYPCIEQHKEVLNESELRARYYSGKSGATS